MSLTTDTTMQVVPASYGSGSGMGWGGDWGAWIILFLLFGLFGWGGFGGGYGGMNGGVGSEVQRGFDHSSVVTKLDGITQGICDSTYALNNAITNGFNNTNMGMMQGFNGVERGFCNLSAQLADCCCGIQRSIDGVNFNAANNTRDIIDSQTNGINAIMGKLAQMEYNGLNDKYQAALAENQALKFQASQTTQNGFIDAVGNSIVARLQQPTPIPAYMVSNPNRCYNSCGNCS